MRFHRVGKRHERVRLQPIDIWRQQDRADSERHIGCRRIEIGGAARIRQRGKAEPGKKRDRPIFGQHGRGGADAGKHRPADPARFERAQEPPRRQRPERRQHRVGVEFHGVKIIERHECQQHDAGDAFVWRQITRRKPPRDPQRDRRQQNGEAIIGPVFARKHAEPCAQQPSAERRMFRRAETDLARPRHELAHVGVDVLAALGDDGVERPDGEIAGKHDSHGALAARRIDQRVEQMLEAIACRENERGHRRDITVAMTRRLGMIRKSGNRFSEKIMLHKISAIPARRSGCGFLWRKSPRSPRRARCARPHSRRRGRKRHW